MLQIGSLIKCRLIIEYKKMIQQQVEVLKFEQVYITKLRQKAQKTHKIRDWLSLLKAYQQNNLPEQKDHTIRTMHYKFILKQQFWLHELERKKTQKNINQEDIEFMMMALQDGLYQKAGEVVFGIVLGLLNGKQKEKEKERKGGLRVNYLIAKLEAIIEIFGHKGQFYSGLREYYKHTNNPKKVRQLYLRELKQSPPNHDILYDEYTLWQPDTPSLKTSHQIYTECKSNWQLQDCQQTPEPLLSRLNNPDRPHFDPVSYLKLVEGLETEREKLRYLRIVCLGPHELVNEYFQKLENVYSQDEQYTLKCYQHVVEMILELQPGYLKFLVRRFNKHIHSSQDAQYNNSWSQKVQYFRERITHFINKPRLTPKTEQSIREAYYNYWIDVETSIVKDKASVCQLFQSLLQTKRTVEMYTKYSQCMIRLGAYGDARNVLRRSCEANKYDYEAYKQYQMFIGVYGTIKEVIQFRGMRAMEEEEQKKTIEKEKENSKEKQRNGVNGQLNGICHENGKQQYHRMEEETRKNSEEIKREDKNQGVERQQRQKASRNPKSGEKSVKKSKNSKHQKPTPQQKIQQQPQPRPKLQQKQPQQQEQQPLKLKLHTDSGNTLFLKGFPPSFREPQITQLIKNKSQIKQIRLVQKKGGYQNYCYIQMTSPESAQQELQQNEHKNEYTLAISKPPSLYSEERTLFLAGLPHTATVEKIREIFQEEKEGIVDVRLKLDDSRNIAYVDFSTPEILQQVLSKYTVKGLAMDGKKIIIKESRSKAKKQPGVIILKRLAFKAKIKDIREFFKDYTLQDVFIPENEQGKSKGFAFVKFKHQNEYHKALELREGEIKGRKFDIVKSDREISRPKQGKRSREGSEDESKSPEREPQKKSSKSRDKPKKQNKKEQDKIDNNFFSNLFK